MKSELLSVPHNFPTSAYSWMLMSIMFPMTLPAVMAAEVCTGSRWKGLRSCRGLRSRLVECSCNLNAVCYSQMQLYEYEVQELFENKPLKQLKPQEWSGLL